MLTQKREKHISIFYSIRAIMLNALNLKAVNEMELKLLSDNHFRIPDHSDLYLKPTDPKNNSFFQPT